MQVDIFVSLLLQAINFNLLAEESLQRYQQTYGLVSIVPDARWGRNMQVIQHTPHSVRQQLDSPGDVLAHSAHHRSSSSST